MHRWPAFKARYFKSPWVRRNRSGRILRCKLAASAQAVEVSIAPDQLLTTLSSSVGNALPRREVADLPIVGRNVMDIATVIMPGVLGDGHANTTFAGLPQPEAEHRHFDGWRHHEYRHTRPGPEDRAFINPDMVDEVRVVVADV